MTLLNRSLFYITLTDFLFHLWEQKTTPAARVDKPKRKGPPAPTELPVPTLSLSDKQLRHLFDVVASRIESRFTASSTGNIHANQSDPFEPVPGNSFTDVMNVEQTSQSVTGILSIDDQLGNNAPNNIKVQNANDQYVNLGKLLLKNPVSSVDAQLLTVYFTGNSRSLDVLDRSK